MQVVRTLVWALILFGLLAFSFFNWDPVEVTLWDNFVLETKVPALVIISFLLGLLPMWAIHRGVKWRLSRRIASLESAARSSALARHEPSSPAATPAAASPVAQPVAADPPSPNDTLNPAKD
jgi:hypothetical protein